MAPLKLGRPVDKALEKTVELVEGGLVDVLQSGQRLRLKVCDAVQVSLGVLALARELEVNDKEWPFACFAVKLGFLRERIRPSTDMEHAVVDREHIYVRQLKQVASATDFVLLQLVYTASELNESRVRLSPGPPALMFQFECLLDHPGARSSNLFLVHDRRRQGPEHILFVRVIGSEGAKIQISSHFDRHHREFVGRRGEPDAVVVHDPGHQAQGAKEEEGVGGKLEAEQVLELGT
mmetsp:Transcript_4980/g.9632  ORF Transcript_4980/g.9632 Transcript_4980/m.9632 type:complete len:236 (+) Transcript_4980:2381-3088(+)